MAGQSPKGQGAFSEHITSLAAEGNAPQSELMVKITVEMDAHTFISVVLIIAVALASAIR